MILFFTTLLDDAGSGGLGAPLYFVD